MGMPISVADDFCFFLCFIICREEEEDRDREDREEDYIIINLWS